MSHFPLAIDLDASTSSTMTPPEQSCDCCSATEAVASSRKSPKSPLSGLSTSLGSRIRKRANRCREKFRIGHLLAQEEQVQLAEEIKICKSYVKSLEKADKWQKKRTHERCPLYGTSVSEELHSSIDEDVSQKHPSQLSQSVCLSSIRRGHPLIKSLQQRDR